MLDGRNLTHAFSRRDPVTFTHKRDLSETLRRSHSSVVVRGIVKSRNEDLVRLSDQDSSS